MQFYLKNKGCLCCQAALQTRRFENEGCLETSKGNRICYSNTAKAKFKAKLTRITLPVSLTLFSTL